MSNVNRHVAMHLVLISWLSVLSVGQAKLTESGSTEIKASSSGGRATVNVQTVVLEGEPAKTCPATRTWIDLGLKRVTVVQGMNISVNGKSIPVPVSTYASLSKVGQMELVHKNAAFILSLSGGDASESYRVQIYFDKTGVLRRMLYDTESNELMEDTHYHHVTIE